MGHLFSLQIYTTIINHKPTLHTDNATSGPFIHPTPGLGYWWATEPPYSQTRLTFQHQLNLYTDGPPTYLPYIPTRLLMWFWLNIFKKYNFHKQTYCLDLFAKLYLLYVV